MRKALISLFIILIPALAFSQRWKAYRYEITYGLGASNFLGELGGANQIGTNYFRDLEFTQTRFAATVGVRYKLNEYLASKTNISYGKVAGNDNLTKEFYRNYRNLNFKSNIYEFATNIEASFMKEQVGHRYRLRGIRGQRGFEMYTYAFMGIGVFYFNPRALYNGQWYELQPLGTEGQGLIPTRKTYSRFQMCIPIGFGFKYTIDRRWGLGLEYGLRKTFTDYIDDVSSTYYDNDAIKANHGPVAAALADRSNQSLPFVTASGQQRGDPRDHDSYMFAIISVNYKLRTGRNNLPKF